MSDLISRQAAIDSIEEHLRCGDELYLLTDTDKVLNHGFEIAASCVYNLPSAEPLTEEDYIELRDRFGEFVEFVVKDMISGKGERWIKTT